MCCKFLLALQKSWHQSVADSRLWVQQQRMNGCWQWRKTNSVAPSSVTLKRIAAGDKIKRQRCAPVYPTDTEAPHHVERGTSVVQSCAWFTPAHEANEGWQGHQWCGSTDGDCRSTWQTSLTLTPSDVVDKLEGQLVWRFHSWVGWGLSWWLGSS